MNPIIAAMIYSSGRSWWQARYSDGRVLSEWNTLQSKIRLPLGLGRSSQWENVTKDGMIGLRLLCPNIKTGKIEVGELEAPEGHKFIQLKVGTLDIGLDGAQGGRFCDAHIIGVVRDTITGDCFCRAWETRQWRLIEFYDNIYNIKYRQIGRLSLDVQGIG
jgi:hypothetical protein